MTVFEQLLGFHIRNLCSAKQHIAPIPSSRQHSSDFSLTDPLACASCPSSAGCDHRVLDVATNTPVDVFAIDELMSILPQSAKTGLKNCDYMMCDGIDLYAVRRIAFCDLNCGNEAYINPGTSSKYPQGKREYAVGQMIGMATFLSGDDMLSHFILTATSRRFVFGVRINNTTPVNPAAASMKAFMRTPSSRALSLQSAQRIAGLGFSYVEVRYPAALNW